MNDLTIYNKHKKAMDTGDTLLYIGESFTGTTISWWVSTFFKKRPDPTMPIFSHGNMVLRLKEYEGKSDRRWVLNADNRGAIPVLLSAYLENYHGHCYWFPLKAQYDLQRIDIGCYALELAGKKYDYQGLIKNAIGLVIAEANKVFCTESIFLAYRDGGKIITGTKAPRPDLVPFLVGADGQYILKPYIQLF
jgi:hypothetical protein